MLAAVSIIWLANYTNADIRLADHAFDFQQHTFPLKHDFVMETVMHQYAKILLTTLWLLILILSFTPLGKLSGYFSTSTRYTLRWITTLAVLNAMVVSALKHQMPHACPWDIVRYGGDSPWVPALTAHPAMQAGHCFPAGHATSGLWLSAFCLLWLPQSPRKALLVSIGGFSIGLLLGWAQQMRGAHFLSHTLTSTWLMSSWLLIALTFSKSRLQ